MSSLRHGTTTAAIAALLLASSPGPGVLGQGRTPEIGEQAPSSIYEGESKDVFGRSNEEVGRKFFKTTIETYAHYCLPDKTPTEAEFEALFANIEGVCEAVMATPECRVKSRDNPHGIEKYALLQCNDLESNFESTPESIWSCVAGAGRGAVNLAEFIGHIIWLMARFAWSPYETSSEYLGGGIAYLVREWEEVSAETPYYRARILRIAPIVAKNIGRALWEALNKFYSRQWREFGCLNRQARLALMCQTITVIFNVGPSMKGFFSLLGAGTAKAGSAIGNKLLGIADSFIARFRASPTGQAVEGAVQTSQRIGVGIATAGRATTAIPRRVGQAVEGTVQIGQRAWEGTKNVSAVARRRARRAARTMRDAPARAIEGARTVGRRATDATRRRAREAVQAVREAPGEAARAVQQAASSAGRVGRVVLNARPTAEALARSQPGTEVSVNILGRGTRNARVVKSIRDDVVQVDFITSSGNVGTELVNINYLGRPLPNLPIPLARATAPAAGTQVSVRIDGATRNGRVLRRLNDQAVEVDYYTPQGVVSTTEVHIGSLGNPLSNMPIPRLRTPPPTFGPPGSAPVQQGLPIPTANVWAGRIERIRERANAGLTRESRRAWRSSRGTMRDARPGQRSRFTTEHSAWSTAGWLSA